MNDLGPLAWVLGEVRTSLDASSKALKRFVRDAAESRGKDLASIDSSQLRLAKQQLRQVVGALDMVDLEKPAQLLRAMEAAVERFIQNPELCSDDAANKIETAGFALTAYLESMLAGRKASALALFPQYEEVQKIAGSARVHPADLWENAWRWATIEAPVGAQPIDLSAEVRAQMDGPILLVMRALDADAAQSLQVTASGLSLSAQMSAQQQTLWRLAAGFFAALAHKLLPADIYVKRAATGVLLQATEQIKDAHSLNTRLAQDLLFFNANIQSREDIPAAVAAVLQAYGLQNHNFIDYQKRVFGHYDPATLVQARKRIAAVKETWSLVTAGESNKYQLIQDQIQSIADSIAKLFPAGQTLADALLAVAENIVRQGKPPHTHVAMEVATSLLYAEAVLEDADLNNPQLEARTERLAERIHSAQHGAVAEPLDAWMEELYRQVSDRQNMGSVVGELKVSLGELEKLMDQFFRNTEDLQPLLQVPDKLAQMRGVMSILGLDDAIKAVQWMREHIERMAIGQLSVAEAQNTGIFEKVGTNLGALGFLIDMLSYQPVLAKKLFIYDSSAAELKPLMGRAQKSTTPHRLAPQEPEAPAAVPLSDALLDTITTEAIQTPDDALDFDLPELAQTAESAPEVVHAAIAAAAAPAAAETGTETGIEGLDDELLDIFLEEASEVVVQGQAAIGNLRTSPNDSAELTTLRRAFHTLKGSSRMVGLNAFGESAWAMEQVLNTWLADAKPATDALLDLSTQAMEIFGDWTARLRNAHSDGPYQPAPFEASAEAMRSEQRYLPLVFAADTAAAVTQAPKTTPSGDEVVADTGLEIPADDEAELTVPAALGADLPRQEEIAAHATLEPSPSAELGTQSNPLPTKLPSLDDVLQQQALESSPQTQAAPTVDVDAIEFILDDAALPLDGVHVAPAASTTTADFTLEPEASLAFELDAPVEAVTPSPEETPALEVQEQALSDADLAFFDLDSNSVATEPAVTTAEFSLETAQVPAIEAMELQTEEAPAATDITLDLATAEADASSDADDGYKVIGDLRISIPLYNAFLGEADDWSRRLVSEITEWSLDTASELNNNSISLAHSLAGTSGTVGHLSLSEFARSLEHCLARDFHLDNPQSAHRHAETYVLCAEEIRRLLHQFAAGILQEPHESMQHRLQLALNDDSSEARVSASMALETSVLPKDASNDEEMQSSAFESISLDAAQPASEVAPSAADNASTIDLGLFPIFAEEADELLPELGASLRQWHAQPQDEVARSSVLRVLHTLKGSARLTGAMHLGEMVHQLESNIEMLGAEGAPSAEIEQLIHHSDDINDAYEALCRNLQNQAEAEESILVEPDAVLEHELDAATATISVVEDSVPVEASPEVLDFAFDVELDEDTESLASAAPVDVVEAPVVSGFSDACPAPSVPEQVAAPAVKSAEVPSTRQAQFIDSEIDAEDSIDENLFPIFEDEANELLPELGNSIRLWHKQPADTQARSTVLRILHTLKGSARLAGAMRLGEMAHQIESNIEFLGAEHVPVSAIEELLGANDDLNEAFQALRQKLQQAADPVLDADEQALMEASKQLISGQSDVQAQKLVDQHLSELTDTAAHMQFDVGAQTPVVELTNSESEAEQPTLSSPAEDSPTLPARALYVLRNSETNTQTVRVRSHLLDLLVNLAGEVMITRAKLENEIGAQLRAAVHDLSGNLERLRQQLRDIEVQAETQMQSRLALSKETAHAFDPLEFDRFTRVQELTRMMAESVNDVATVQRNMQSVADATEGALVAQARQTRELQRYLLRTRMVEFDSISDRLYRVIRQAGKDTNKQVRLDIVGASIELDRGVLERMTPAFEHLLRNCVAHGIEDSKARHAAGKEAAGLITIQVRQEGNDVAIEFKDDGAGLNVGKILEKAEQKGLITKETVLSEQDIFNLIYHPGFSTASEVTAVSGRGVGMDVVRNEVQSLGGRIETHSVGGKGSSFKLVLPLTTAVTQVVMVRVGHLTFGVPANLLEVVRRVGPEELEQAYAEQHIIFQGERVPFQWAGALLQASPHSAEAVGRSTPIAIIRSAAQRVAVHVDEVLGNQEVVVKNLGPQLSRLPGLAGMSLLPSGAVVLIYNPVALHTVYRERAVEYIQQAKLHHLQMQQQEAQTPLVMVVDDSITVRRVTQRLLQREGYRVLLANDGLMALEKLAEGEELPCVILSDIEMPRMDGYDLARNIRGDQRLTHLPIVMITSRMAEKHREHAMSLGVNHYLGKPYGEEELLEIIHSYTHDAAAKV